MAEVGYDSIDGIVEQFLRYMEGEGQTPPSLEGLTAEEKAEARAVLQLLEACWGTASLQVPPLEEDPLAVELGLVTKQTALVMINGSAVKLARKRRGLNIRQAADMLSDAGHAVDLRWVLDVEQGSINEVPGEFAGVLAEVLGVPIAQLMAAPQTVASQGNLEVFLNSQAFRERVQHWGRAHDTESGQAMIRFSSMMRRAAARTKGNPNHEEWLRILDELMETHES